MAVPAESEAANAATAVDHTTAMTEAAGHGGEAAAGLPQFDPQWWAGQIFWLVVLFVVLYLALSKILLPKVGRTIEARNQKIADDLAQAYRVKAEAEEKSAAAAAELAETRARIQRSAAEAKAKAAAEAAEREAAEQKVLDAKIAEAEGRIRAARDSAMASVRDVASDTAAAITEKLTGKAATSQEVAQALSGLSA